MKGMVMNSAYNGVITLIVLALVLLPLILSAYFQTPEVSEPEEYDYR
jgi:hypothetical protein